MFTFLAHEYLPVCNTLINIITIAILVTKYYRCFKYFDGTSTCMITRKLYLSIYKYKYRVLSQCRIHYIGKNNTVVSAVDKRSGA